MTLEENRTAPGASTRSQLVAVARRLFAERGFAGTATEEVVARSGVTRGALYYHFRNKQDLFRAVFAEVVEEVHQQVNAAAMATGEPREGLLAGCAAYLDASADPAVQRIALVDGPSVLGWDEWRELGSQHLFGLLATGFHWAMAAGQIEDRPVTPLIHVLLGALNEGALFIGRAPDRNDAREQVAAVISRFIVGLSSE